MVDSFGGHACFDELGVDDAAQVHVGSAVGTEVKDVGHGAAAGELDGHVVSDFEAAPFDVRANGGEQIGCLVIVGEREFTQELDDIADDVVLFDEAIKILSGWKGATFIETKDLGHSMHNDQLYNQVSDYLFGAQHS